MFNILPFLRTLSLPPLLSYTHTGGGFRSSRFGGGARGGSNYDSPAAPGPVPASGHYATLGVKSTATTAEVRMGVGFAM